MNPKALIAFLKKQPITLVCLAICVIAAGAIYYRRGALTDAKADLESKTDEGGRILTNVKNSTELAEQFAALNQSTQTIEARLVHAGDLALNLQYFYKLESDTHTKLVDLRQNGPSGKRAGNYQGIDYTVATQGTYPQILDFLRRVEAGTHYSQIHALTLSRSGSAEGGAPVKLITINLALSLLGVP